ncbi:sulfotransferase [Seongchinamella sediminis]|uniref:Sulfotransferase n=1 Tax=Seongchinamella sediminis TaxID=2283635 RepID=A0A3L7DS86_9GAMM|nr:sulfotransferase [Seongchinamella sediminis]RLQ20368.1 sulfotransferase [Seongchinamella sediminis]
MTTSGRRQVKSLQKLLKLLDADIRAKNLHAAKLALRGQWWDMLRPEQSDPIFLVGCSRSGTTVTYETLIASGAFLNLGYEIPQFWNSLYGPLNNGWESEAAGAQDAKPEHRDSALRYFYQRLGAGVVLDKTCINTLRVPYLYKLFPNARFVFIHRDGRDNISSMIDGWRQGRTDGAFGLDQFFGPSPEPVSINSGEFKEWHFFLPPGWRDYNHANLEDVCAYQWLTANGMALEASTCIPPEQWIQIRYEDILDRPVDLFSEVFGRLGVTFDKQLEAHCASLDRRPTSIVSGPPQREKWRERHPDEIERILPDIAPMMRKLEYEVSN